MDNPDEQNNLRTFVKLAPRLHKVRIMVKSYGNHRVINFRPKKRQTLYIYKYI